MLQRWKKEKEKKSIKCLALCFFFVFCFFPFFFWSLRSVRSATSATGGPPLSLRAAGPINTSTPTHRLLLSLDLFVRSPTNKADSAFNIPYQPRQLSRREKTWSLRCIATFLQNWYHELTCWLTITKLISRLFAVITFHHSTAHSIRRQIGAYSYSRLTISGVCNKRYPMSDFVAAPLHRGAWPPNAWWARLWTLMIPITAGKGVGKVNIDPSEFHKTTIPFFFENTERQIV